MYRIWIMEDDDNIATIVSEHLEKYGYEARRVQEYDHIKSRLLSGREQPYLILLDR